MCRLEADDGAYKCSMKVVEVVSRTIWQGWEDPPWP
jgi:hypothetical protein